jgi:hypothetical protein
MFKTKAAVATVSILGGGVLGILLMIILRGFGGAFPGVAGNPNDSPVTVRGGSLVVVSPNSWNSNCAQPGTTSCDVTLNATTATLQYIDGVDSPTAPPHRVDNPITTNWVITLSYRDDSGKNANDTKKLQICTKSDCTYDNNPASHLLHLKGDGMGVFSTDNLDHHSARYDESCGTDAATGKTTLCNHIYVITVESSSGKQAYHCADGACSIGIGVPPT